VVNSHRPFFLRLVRSHIRFCEPDEPEKPCHGSVWRIALRNRIRPRQRCNTAYGRCAGRQRRCRDKFAIPLPRRRTISICGRVAGHTGASKGVAVGVRRRETVGERFQKGDDLVFLLIRQAEHPGRCVEIVRNLFHWPAGDSLYRSFRAVSGSDRVGKGGVARVVEMYQLLQEAARRKGSEVGRHPPCTTF
jgi:hypothetical protein